MFISHLPGFMYRILPWIYIGAGIVTVIKLPGLFGMVSGLLLMVAGLLVLYWRKPGVARQPAQTATRSQKNQSRHRGIQNGHVAPSPRRVDAVPAASLRTGTTDEASGPAEQDGDRQGPSAVPGISRLERRKDTADRRSWHSMPQIPFLDSKDVVVTKDRRKTPDRRMGNIVVEEL